MDINKFIDEHLDELIENPELFLSQQLDHNIPTIKDFDNTTNGSDDDDEQNEDEEDNDDRVGDLFQLKHELKNIKNNDREDSENSDSEDDEKREEKKILDEESDSEFYFSLINIFMKYFNEKFDKNEHFFSGIKNFDKETSNQMELFFEAIFEFKQIKEHIEKEIGNDLQTDLFEKEKSVNEIVLKFLFPESDVKKVEYLFDNWDGQIYCLTIGKNKYISPSLLVCLNYVLDNKLQNDNSWHIFHLKDN